MKKIEHIGIAVENIEKANSTFTKLLGTSNYKIEIVESEGLKHHFLKLVSKIELLEATNDESPISKFIKKKGQGIHHLAFHVDDIDENDTTQK